MSVRQVETMKAIHIAATYSHGTPNFWCYEYNGELGIFKFWIRHSEKTKTGYRSLRPPKTMAFLVDFVRPDK